MQWQRLPSLLRCCFVTEWCGAASERGEEGNPRWTMTLEQFNFIVSLSLSLSPISLYPPLVHRVHIQPLCLWSSKKSNISIDTYLSAWISFLSSTSHGVQCKTPTNCRDSIALPRYKALSGVALTCLHIRVAWYFEISTSVRVMDKKPSVFLSVCTKIM